MAVPQPPVPPTKGKFPFPQKGAKASVPGKPVPPKSSAKTSAVNLKDSMARRLQNK